MTFDFASFVLPIAAVFMYIAAFASTNWVTANGEREWGLWSTCLSSSNDSSNEGETTECDTISPGDSDVYFEVVRTLACFTLVSYLLMLRTLDTRTDAHRHTPCFAALIASAMTAGTLAVLGICFENDQRWKDADPRLGWCYWLTLSAGSVCILMSVVFHSLHKAERNERSSGARGRTITQPEVVVQTVEGVNDYVLPSNHPDDDAGRSRRTRTLLSHRNACFVVEDPINDPVLLLPPSYMSLFNFQPPPEGRSSGPGSQSQSCLPGRVTPSHGPPRAPRGAVGHSDRLFTAHTPPPAYERDPRPGSFENVEDVPPPSYEEAINTGR